MCVDESVQPKHRTTNRHPGRRTAANVGLLVACVALLFPTTATSADEVVFGPQTYTATGRPLLSKRTFTVLHGGDGYTLRVTNHGAFAVLVVLNGRIVLRPRDFRDPPDPTSGDDATMEREWDRLQRGWRPDINNHTVPLIEKPVTLRSGPNDILVAFIGRVGVSFSVDIFKPTNDTTAPTITPSVSPLPNANGWNNTNVMVTFACLDTGSGIATCPDPVTVSGEGAHQVVSGTAADRAGNQATANITLNIDKTAPSLDALLAPAANGNGWRNTSVVAHFTCADSGSGISICPADQVVSADGTGLTITGTAVDQAGNQASLTTSPFNIDQTPPAISVALTGTKTDGIYTPPVIAHFTCVDVLSGVAACPADQVITAPGIGLTVTGTVADLAGNSSSVTSQPFSVQTSTGTATHVVLHVETTPSWVPSGVATNVSVFAWIPSDGAAVVNGSVRLRRLDSNGQPISDVVELVDDGTHGDVTAADQIFTGTISLNETGPAIAFFDIAAFFADQSGSLTSDPFALAIRVDDSPTIAISELAKALRNGSRLDAYKRLGARLNFAQVLDTATSDSLARLADALNACVVTLNSDAYEVCTAQSPLPDVGQFEFHIVRDALGTWRVISW